MCYLPHSAGYIEAMKIVQGRDLACEGYFTSYEGYFTSYEGYFTSYESYFTSYEGYSRVIVCERGTNIANTPTNAYKHTHTHTQTDTHYREYSQLL